MTPNVSSHYNRKFSTQLSTPETKLRIHATMDNTVQDYLETLQNNQKNQNPDNALAYPQMTGVNLPP